MKFITNHKQFLMAFLIWVLAISIRGGYFYTHQNLGQDQARDLMMAEDVVEKGNWIIGYGAKGSVGGFYLPPLYYYAQSIVYSISPWPLSMSVVVTVVESFTGILLFVLLSKYFSREAGIVGGTLYSIAPLAVIYGTTMWNPTMVPFFSTLALLFAFIYLSDKKPLAIIGLVTCVAILFHLHYQSFVVVPFYVGLSLYSVWKQPKHLKFWVLGGLLGASTLISYIWVEVQQNWQNTSAILEYFSSEHSQYFDRISKPAYVFTYLPGFFGRVLFKESNYAIALFLGRLVYFCGLIAMISVVLLPLHILGKKFTLVKRNSLIMLLYMVSIFIAMRLYKGDKIDYYLSTMFIFPAIWLGILSTFARLQKIIYLSVIVYIFWISLLYLKLLKQAEYSYQDVHDVYTFIGSEVLEQSTYVVPHHPDLENIILYSNLHFADFPISSTDPTYLAFLCLSHTRCEREKPKLIQHRYNFCAVPIAQQQFGAYTVQIIEL